MSGTGLRPYIRPVWWGGFVASGLDGRSAPAVLIDL